MHFRIALRLLLGLVFLVQGTLVVAAPWKADAPMAKAVQVEKCAQHDKAGSCCNPACPDMTTCSLAFMAALPTTRVPLILVAAHHVPAVAAAAPVRIANPLLRPPIKLHS